VAEPGVFTPYIDAMHAANASLNLFVYLNGTFTWHKDLPESYYLHDQSGNRIYPFAFPTTYLLNVSRADVTAWLSQQAAALIGQSRYDGLYLDVLGPSPLSASAMSGL